MSLKILHLTQYFPPEPGAVQVRAAAMARYLTEAGHRVTVLTEMPNHPKGIIYSGYRGKLLSREEYNQHTVLRVWVFTSPKKNFFTRIAFYLSYMFTAILRGIFISQPVDIIYANSPPLFTGVAAAVLSWLKNRPLVFEVQDLWPESAVDMGELKNPGVIRLSTWLEERCYQHARKIICVSEGIYRRLRERGIPAEKLVMIENGSNTDLFKPLMHAGQELRARWGLEDKFIVFYGGIIGLAQGLEVIVEAAHLLSEHDDIHFVMVGDGPCREEIENLISKYNLTNFTFLPGQPLEAMPAHLAAADLALAPLRNLPVFEGVRPTKILDAWACRKPVIASARGEPCRMVETAKGGVCTQPEDPAALSEAILQLQMDPEACAAAASSGYQFVQENYSLRAMANKLEAVLIHMGGE